MVSRLLVLALLSLGCGPGGPSVPEPAPPPAAPVCTCHSEACPPSLGDALRTLRTECSEVGYVLTQSIGCGRIELVAGYAFEGEQYFFDERDDSLIGATYYSDMPVASCRDFGPLATFKPCPSATSCSICGEYRGMSPCSDAR